MKRAADAWTSFGTAAANVVAKLTVRGGKISERAEAGSAPGIKVGTGDADARQGAGHAKDARFGEKVARTGLGLGRPGGAANDNGRGTRGSKHRYGSGHRDEPWVNEIASLTPVGTCGRGVICPTHHGVSPEFISWTIAS